MKSSTDTTIFFPFRILQKDICYHIIIIIIQVGLLFEVQLNGIPDCKRMVISIKWETKNRKEKRKRKLHYVTLVSVIEDIAFKLNTQSWLNYTNFHVYQMKYEQINWKRKTFLWVNQSQSCNGYQDTWYHLTLSSE